MNKALRSRRAGGALLIGILAVTPVGRAGDGPPATRSAADLRAQLGRADAGVTSYFAVYQLIPTDAAAQTIIHREVGAFGPASFYHRSAKGNTLYVWADDPLQQQLRMSGSRGVSERPVNRSFVTFDFKPGEQLPGTAPQELLFPVLGWWPLRDVAPPTGADGSSVVFAQIARSSGYVGRPFQERRNGRLCHVLEMPRHDRLWLDATRGGALVARETVDPQTGNVRQRVEVTEDREVLPGTWAPVRFRTALHDLGPGSKTTAESEIVIRELTVNQMPPDSMFDLRPQPGWIEGENDGGFSQRVPGGVDHLDETARRINLLRRPPPATAPLGSSWLPVLVSNAASVVLIGGFAYLKRRHQRRAALGVEARPD